MRKIFSILILVFAHASYAQSVDAPGAFDRFMDRATGVGKQSVGFGTNGTPIINSGVPTITPDGGLPRVDVSGQLRNPSGNPVGVAGTGRIPGSGIVKPIGKFLGKVLPGISIAIALKELADELGFDLSRDASGAVVIKKSDPTVCTVDPCYEYSSKDFTGGTQRWWMPTVSAAANDFVQRGSAWSANYNYVLVGTGGVPSGATITYDLTAKSDGSFVVRQTEALPTRSVPANPAPPLVPATQQEFIDAIAAKSGWPSSSAIGRAIVATGEKLDPVPLTVTGPATSPGTTTTTNNTTNNTTKTETTTHNHTYQGDTVITTTVTVTNITNNTTGDTISEETTTSEPAPTPEPVETCGLPGKPACKIDETDTPPAPDLKPADKVTEVMKPLDDFVASPESKLPALPALNWSFALPTGCTAISLPAFAPFLQDIDICPFLPMFHDVMSIVWILGGLFGAIGTFWRNVFSQN